MAVIDLEGRSADAPCRRPPVKDRPNTKCKKCFSSGVIEETNSRQACPATSGLKNYCGLKEYRW